MICLGGCGILGLGFLLFELNLRRRLWESIGLGRVLVFSRVIILEDL